MADPCVTALDLAAVRSALTATLEGITFDTQPLRVNAWFAEVLNPPCALVGAFSVEFRDPSYADLTALTCPVRLVVPVPSLRPAQQDLDELIGLFYAALVADPTLQGNARAVIAVRATPVTTTRGNAEFPSYDAETHIVI